jgi:outer membrane biosynthesis protein TonB
MADGAIRRDEAAGLILAVALHAGVLALLLLHPAPRPAPLPDRMEVTIADAVGPTDTAPSPARQAAPETDTTLGEPQPAPAAPPPAPAPPKPVPVHTAPPPPPPKPAPQPRPEPKPSPRPQPVATTRPAPAPAPVKSKPLPARPDPIADALAHARTAKLTAAAGHAPTPAKPAKTPGASRIGNDFLKGLPGSQSASKIAGTATVAAAAIGPEVKAGLSSAIARQLKPRWVAPQGADAEQLVTILAWDLNPDGTLAGTPRLVRQEGITESNRPQAPRHVEQAIRAVELAAPFDLPPEYYAAWKRVSAFRFDRKLSQ